MIEGLLGFVISLHCNLLNSQSTRSSGHSPVSCNLQNKKKTTAVSRHPSDGKVSLFLEGLEFLATIVSIQNLVPFLE